MNETESFGMFTSWRIDVSDPDALFVWLAFQILLPQPQSFSSHAHHPMQIDCEATLQSYPHPHACITAYSHSMGCPDPCLTEETAEGKAVDSLLKHVRVIENSELRIAFG